MEDRKRDFDGHEMVAQELTEHAQNPRSTFMVTPFTVVMWGTCGGLSVCVAWRASLLIDLYSLPIRHDPKGAWLQQLLRQGVTSMLEQGLEGYVMIIRVADVCL